MDQARVLDSSAFLSNRVRDPEGLEKTISEFTKAMNSSEARFLMPRTTYNELSTILESEGVSKDARQNLRSQIDLQKASRYEVQVPGEFFRIFVSEMRDRIDKGLRTGDKALKEFEEVEQPENPYMDRADKAVSDFRSSYREKMRKGVPDSVEDVDLILTARQGDFILVSEDKGVLNWASEMGVAVEEPQDLARGLGLDT